MQAKCNSSVYENNLLISFEKTQSDFHQDATIICPSNVSSTSSLPCDESRLMDYELENKSSFVEHDNVFSYPVPLNNHNKSVQSEFKQEKDVSIQEVKKCKLCGNWPCESKCCNSQDVQKSQHNSKKENVCLTFNKGFLYKQNVKRHIRENQSHLHQDDQKSQHNSNKKYVCLACNKGFLNKQKFKRHLRESLLHQDNSQPNSIKKFICFTCNKKFSYKRNLKRHIKDKHSSDTQTKCKSTHEADSSTSFSNPSLEKPEPDLLPIHKQKYICVPCNKGFQSKYSINRHIESIHNKKYKCTVVDQNIKNQTTPVECGKTFTRRLCLDKHIIFIHSKFEKEHAVPRINNTYNCAFCGNWYCSPRSISVAYKCTICEQTLNDKGYFRSHLKCHEAPDWCICSDCGKAFRTISHLKNHQRIHGDKNYQCDICGKQFVFKNVFQYHMAKHKGLHKTFACEQCQKQFKTLSSLSFHMNRHKGIQPYKCQQCTASFFSLNDLKKHYSRHSGKPREYQCNICGNDFKSLKTLNVHKMIHNTNGKPYTCDKCGKQFILKHHLTAHITRTHGTKTIPCPKCEKYFTCSFYLKMHMVTHTREKRYECVECSKAFIRSDYLVKHMTMHNPIKNFVCDKCGKQFNRKDYLKCHVRIMHSNTK